MTPTTATPPALTETEWQKQVTDLAELLGYSWAHFRPAQTAHGWRTPVSGPLGAGFPDLVLARPGRHSGMPGETPGRLIFAELKRHGGRLTADQERVGELLLTAGAEWHVWWPQDLDRVMEVLR
jgi:hypothetical protein